LRERTANRMIAALLRKLGAANGSRWRPATAVKAYWTTTSSVGPEIAANARHSGRTEHGSNSIADLRPPI
jgi:hypothetical protein